MKLKIVLIIVAVLLSACAASGGGQPHGYVTSIAQPIPQENLFQINVQRVNGKQPTDGRNSYVPAGEATIRVSLIPNPQFMPQLTRRSNEISVREITLTVEEGATYQLAGKVNPYAADDEPYWKPVVHRKL